MLVKILEKPLLSYIKVPEICLIFSENGSLKIIYTLFYKKLIYKKLVLGRPNR